MSTNEHHMDWPPSEPKIVKDELIQTTVKGCLLYTSDAADE